MKIKVYSIVVLERFITEGVEIDASNPMVSTNKVLIDTKVGELMAELGQNYGLEEYEWKKCDSQDGQSCSYSKYDEEGDGYTISVNIHEIEV